MYATPGRPRPRRFHDFSSGESVPQGLLNENPPAPPDPPIYRALMRSWADGGRTVPGRYDPEWVRLAAPPAGLGIVIDPFSASPDPSDDER